MSRVRITHFHKNYSLHDVIKIFVFLFSSTTIPSTSLATRRTYSSLSWRLRYLKFNSAIRITSPFVISYTPFRLNTDISMTRSFLLITTSKLVMNPTLSLCKLWEKKSTTVVSTWMKSKEVILISKPKLQQLANKLRAEKQKSTDLQETVRLNPMKDANYVLTWTIWTTSFQTNVKTKLETNKKLTDSETSIASKSVKMLKLHKELKLPITLCIRIKKNLQIWEKFLKHVIMTWEELQKLMMLQLMTFIAHVMIKLDFKKSRLPKVVNLTPS